MDPKWRDPHARTARTGRQPARARGAAARLVPRRTSERWPMPGAHVPIYLCLWDAKMSGKVRKYVDGVFAKDFVYTRK